MLDSFFLYHSVSLSPSSQSACSSSSHSLHTSHPLQCHSTTYNHQPIHFISYTTQITALHDQFGCDVMQCCSHPYGLHNIFIFLGLNLLEPIKIFVIWMVPITVPRILNVCSGFLCCVCGLISLSSWFFLWFLICRLVQGLFLSFVLNL
jgi:hypothetical protein